jgi:hypothetical protein
VGSSRIESVIDSKFGGPITTVPPEEMARVVVFQTWLRGEDAAALIGLDGSFALSIDHGMYLTGMHWNDAALGDVLPSGPVTAQWPSDRLRNSAVFQKVLAQLMAIPEEAIVQQFAGIPREWGGSLDFMARLADFVLRRRANVETAVATLYQGVA